MQRARRAARRRAPPAEVTRARAPVLPKEARIAMNTEALWSMDIKDGERWVAAGVCVLADGKLIGGDNGHVFIGEYEIAKDHVEGEIQFALYRVDDHRVKLPVRLIRRTELS
jgi:hypothetical protein